MDRNVILMKVNEIFCDVFDNNSIVVTEKTSASDIEDWDSLAHITLVTRVETTFGFKFDMKDVAEMQDVGEMLDIIERKLL